jgi:solute carrier family 9B (sodium/hydrogen exchanger), member 1/2
LKINELDPDIVSWGVLILLSGVIIRIVCTAAIAFGDKLNLKEKVSLNEP